MGPDSDLSPLRTLQETVRDLLAADPWFTEHRVRILIQDEGSIKDLVDGATLPLEGPLLVVAITDVQPNPPGFIVSLDLIATENVIVNRSHAGFATALDVAWRTTQILTQPDFTPERLSHEMNTDGLFQAVASFRY